MNFFYLAHAWELIKMKFLLKIIYLEILSYLLFLITLILEIDYWVNWILTGLYFNSISKVSKQIIFNVIVN